MANPRYYQEPKTDRTTEKLKQLAALKAMGRRDEPPQGQQQRIALQLLDTIMSARQQQQQNSAQEATHNRNIDVGALVNLAPTSPVAMRALQNAIPALAQAQQQVTGEQTAEQVRQLNPVLRSAYAKGAPKPEVLDALKQTYPLGFESPDVPWDALNQSVVAPAAVSSNQEKLLNLVTAGNYNTLQQIPDVVRSIQNFISQPTERPSTSTPAPNAIMQYIARFMQQPR